MSAPGINDDFSQTAMADTEAMDWQASPSPSVWRKRLDLAGPAEAGRVTSVVRYDPGSRFHAHPHPDGEEILVIDGVFSDESGDYAAGSYLLNPEGFEHAPRSVPGCTLFVKLRQYPGTARRHVALATGQAPWSGVRHGVSRCVLYDEEGYPETMVLLRVEDGAAVPMETGGNELFVLSGALLGHDAPLPARSWLRLPDGTFPRLIALGPTELYRKSGHLRSGQAGGPD